MSYPRISILRGIVVLAEDVENHQDAHDTIYEADARLDLNWRVPTDCSETFAGDDFMVVVGVDIGPGCGYYYGVLELSSGGMLSLFDRFTGGDKGPIPACKYSDEEIEAELRRLGFEFEVLGTHIVCWEE